MSEEEATVIDLLARNAPAGRTFRLTRGKAGGLCISWDSPADEDPQLHSGSISFSPAEARAGHHESILATLKRGGFREVI